MTSEIALLNRTAIALAADSALTVSSWQNGKYETRYFTGANKIFQLSQHHPVGVMIYATDNLQGAPWEMLIKSYRDSIGPKSHDDLHGYASDLFDYIVGNVHIFPKEFQENQFKFEADMTATRIFAPTVTTESFKNAADDAAKLEIAKEKMTRAEEKVVAAEFLGNATQADVDSALSKFLPEIKVALEKDRFFSIHSKFIDFDQLTRIGIIGVFKRGHSTLTSSGLVVAGFGDKDYFPRLKAYRCFGLVLGKLIWAEEKEKSQKIDQNYGSAIVPFAQDEMINTFIFGTGASILEEIDKQFVKCADDFCTEMQKAGISSAVDGDDAKTKKLEELKTKAKDLFTDALVDSMINSHSKPMRRVVSLLPLDELAELAETLVSIESLKERVTRPSTSVGGPIDVAVISKNDGFIWVKRKHYFDPKLNPRYFVRRSMERGS